MAENGRSVGGVIAVIGLATAVVGLVTAVITLRGNNQAPPQTQPTATSAVNSSTAGPVGPSSVPSSRTPSPGSTRQQSAQPITANASVSGVPKQGVPDQQVTMHGSGFPKGGALQVTFAIGPGQDFPLSFPPPQQVDSQGSFTFTFTIDRMFCGYRGQINTYDFGGDGKLLTSSPLAVVC